MKDMKFMRKNLEEMQMTMNEKDAEIIKLNMHLGDEKKRNSTLYRKETQKTLIHNSSSSSLLKRGGAGAGLSEAGLFSSIITSNEGGAIATTPSKGQAVAVKEDNATYETLMQLKEENQQLI